MKIYLDMDGVFSDFDSYYESLIGTHPKSVKGAKERNENWKKFVMNASFEKLPFLTSAYVLLEFIHDRGLEAEMLTSSGGTTYHVKVALQKKYWLIKHGINFKANVVPGGMKKATFAKPDAVLIDDTARNIEAFEKAGGIGILHNHENVGATIDKLKEILM